MRDYEIAFIARPDLDETSVKELVEKVSGWVTDSGGSVANVDFWGKRKLAYEIRKQKEGQYVFVKTQMDPTVCSKLERNLRLTESVLRFMVTEQS